MICVTIGRGRHRMVQEEWKAAAEAGAQLVEIRADCLRREVDLRRLLATRPTPVVFTVRKIQDGGLWRGDEEKRRQILREAIAAGVEYIDLEADTAAAIPRFGKTKRIVSYHNMKLVPEELEGIVTGLRDHQADIVKFAVLTRTVPEAARVLSIVKDAKVPTIGIAMGSQGFFTRVLGAKYGSPITYAGFNPDRTFAPGMPLMKELDKDYCYDQINAETEVYGVIGDPIGHSLSPAIHNAAFRQLGLNKVLVPFHIQSGTLKESLESLNFLNLRGVSVTIPHKETVISLLKRHDRAVEMTGACNTLVLDENGQWEGHNTDYHAAITTLESAMGGAMAHDASPLLDKQVLIVGAGGVARAIAFGLARRGAGVIVCNRTEERAIRLAEEVGCRSIPFGMRAGTLCDVIINCTPVGMYPNMNETPVPSAAFRNGMIVFDTIYHPENTLFLKQAEERDCQIVSGVEMFVRQAALQFKYYTGQEAPLELMRDVVRRKFSVVKDG